MEFFVAMNNVKSNLPPKVRGIPYVGSLFSLQKQKMDFWLENLKIYGDIFRVQFGKQEAVMIGSPDYVKHVFVDNKKNYQEKGNNQGALFQKATFPLIGKGMALSKDPTKEWQELRKHIQGYFSVKNLNHLQDLMLNVIDDTIDSWKKDTLWNIEEEITYISMRIATQTIFGIDISKQKCLEIAKKFRYLVDYLYQAMLNEVLPSFITNSNQEKFNKNLKELCEIGEWLIKNTNKNDSSTFMTDIFKKIASDKFDSDIIYIESVTLLLGGYESTSSVLTTIFLHLTKDPSIQMKAIEEIKHNFGDQKPTIQSLQQLSYLEMVIDEAMRMYPPTYWIQRIANNDDIIGGYNIPAGSYVVTMMPMLFYNSKFWENPDKFMPERFIKKIENTYLYIPFGFGKRMCFAKQFSYIKMKFILVRFFQSLSIEKIILPPKIEMGVNIRWKSPSLAKIDLI